MSGLTSLPNSTQGYSVAGYKPGDRIGAGVVVDPAEVSKNDATKIVTIDLNLNGKADGQDDQLLVKLPPKGFVPAGWTGLSAESTLKQAFPRMAGYGAAGAVVGAFLGLCAGGAADAGVFGAKAATETGSLRVGLAVGLGVAVTGAAIGYFTKKTEVDEDGNKARASAVPDLIQPKYILNQYLSQQIGTAVVGSLPSGK